VTRHFLVAALISLLIGRALAQDVDPDLKNRPPIAAPTEKVEVNPITVVRSLSEEIEAYGSGLIQGLMTGEHVRGVLLVAVQDARVIVTKNFGCCLNSDQRISDGFYSDLFVSLGAMQEIERGKLDPEKDGVGLMLSHQIDARPLRGIVEKAAGRAFRPYAIENLLGPMNTGGGDETSTLPRVIGNLLVALLNGGSFEGGKILEPGTVELMEQSKFSLHPALPGWTYGFAEMRRNNWRVLQYDGAWENSPPTQARLVIVPEAKIAYAIITDGVAPTEFWRSLDDGLFDRIIPAHEGAAPFAATGAPPTLAQANAVAGSYEASDEPLASVAALKYRGRRLLVRPTSDGGLALSGAVTAFLAPKDGGYWGSENGNLNAIESNGRLVLSSGIFRPLPVWKRPLLYASLAFLFAVGAGGALIGSRRRKPDLSFPSDLVLALSAASLGFLFVGAAIWLPGLAN
jgi:hypothetical protein